jgi:DnaJ-class molecular chaperone
MSKKDEEPYKSWKKADPEIDQFKVCKNCKGLGDYENLQGEWIRCDQCKGTGTVKK